MVLMWHTTHTGLAEDTRLCQLIGYAFYGVSGVAVEAAAAIAVPLLGAGPAVAVGLVGAVVVSPLLMAGLWRAHGKNCGRYASLLHCGSLRLSSLTLTSRNPCMFEFLADAFVELNLALLILQ
eukprot:6482543-Amphidinium_carterae.1